MSATQLPQEIIEYIVGYLVDDKTDLGITRTLKSCCLVSHAFLPSSQKQLFGTILLRTAESAHWFSRLLQQGRLCIYVHSLILIHVHPRLTELCHPRAATRPWFENRRVVSTILDHIGPRLQSFSLIGFRNRVPWTWLSPRVRASLLCVFASPALRDLTVHSVTDLPLAVLMGTAHLRSLHLSDVGVDAAAPPGVGEGKRRLAYLDTLTLSNPIPGTGSALVAVFAHPRVRPGLSRLRRLVIHPWVASELDEANTILQATPQLEHVEWDNSIPGLY